METLQRATKWAAQYFTNPRSYYPIPENSTKFMDMTMTINRIKGMSTDAEGAAMKTWVEPFQAFEAANCEAANYQGQDRYITYHTVQE